MSNTEKVSPKVAMENIRNNAMFAVIQFVAMKNGLYTYKSLPGSVDWKIEDKTLKVVSRIFTDESFKRLVENQMRAIFGVWATAVDSMLNDTFKGEPYEDTDEERRAIRCIVYMFRCAFAHNPIEPKWNVTNENYKGVFNVPSINYTLSTIELNGKIIGKVEFDWFGFINLLKYCETLVD